MFRHSLLKTLLTVALPLLTFPARAADEPPLPLKEFLVGAQPPDIPPPRIGGIEMDLIPVPPDGKSPVVGYAPTISYSYLRKHITVTANMLVLPPLRDGEVVPTAGRLYRITGAGRPTVFRWLPPASLPAGLKAVQADSLFVPVQRHQFGSTEFPGNTSLALVRIEQEAEGKKALIAELEYRGLGDKSLGRAKVREGDVVSVGKLGGFVVRSIVPPDDKAKILGWVELSSKPILGDDLRKLKPAAIRLGSPE